VHHAGLGRLAPPPAIPGGAARWAGRIAVAAAAFAAGAALRQAGDPLQLVAVAGVGGLALAGTLARLRWCLVAALFLMVAYVPDVLASRAATHALIALLLASMLLRSAAGRERLTFPRELVPFAGLGLAYVVASLGASDGPAAAAETLDLVSYGAVIALLLALVDTPTWLRRAVWGVVCGVGLLAVLAILQQVTRTYGSTYGGLATVLEDGDAMRSAGPLNPNPFGQILATSGVLALYLAGIESRSRARLLAAAIGIACVVALVYTQSRAALLALVIVAILAGVLRGVRLPILAAAVCGAIAVSTLVIPHSLQQRVDALGDAASSGGPTLQDGSLLGRKSENLAALRMWGDHPLLGVGPDNFEVHYLAYSEKIGIDQRAERRGAHNLYLESLAETGVLGTFAFLGVVWLGLSGAWRARARLTGADALLGEALLVALAAFFICALTLNSAYARYQWLFLGLGLAAGSLARRAAR
jgi:putative inorganic carbon (hco3(-)) transporter